MALTQLPLASGERHQEVFESLGWNLRVKGNHIVLTHPHHPQVFLSIPNHKEVKRGTLKRIVRDAGLSDEQYAVFFDGIPKAKRLEEDDADLFTGKIEPDGRWRVHCAVCCQPVCLSADEGEIKTAQSEHIRNCTGPI